MLSPKVLTLKPPNEFNLSLEGSSINDTIKRQYFNHSVSMLMPDTLQPPQSVLDVLSNDTEYYHIHDLPAYELIDRQFINLFVKTGSLTLLSVEKRIDQDNNISILPNGLLMILLTSESFHALGLEGKHSDSVEGRFVIKIDLKMQNLTIESSQYLRIVQRLQAVPDLKFNVILSWEPNDKTLCPSSIAAWFSKAAYVVSTCSNQFQRNTLYSMNVPNVEENDLSEVLEWIGMAHIQCDLQPSQRAISSYMVPEPNTPIGQIVSLQWTGLLTSSRISEAFQRLQAWSNDRGSECWIALIVNGFEDSITSQGEREHTYSLEGGYNISAILQPNKSPRGLLHISPAGKCKNRKRRLID